MLFRAKVHKVMVKLIEGVLPAVRPESKGPVLAQLSCLVPLRCIVPISDITLDKLNYCNAQSLL
jgi:hypothetical protein